VPTARAVPGRRRGCFAKTIVKNCKIVQFFRGSTIEESLECAPHFKCSTGFNTSLPENTLKKRKTTLCIGLAAALSLAAASAAAQVYSWRDPATGQTKLSNIPPPWYNRGETVHGPRVVATIGGRVVDDTGLAYDDRLQLSGRPKEQIGKLQPQKQQSPAAPEPPKRKADEPPAR